jgi:hypothetical protein
MKNKWEVPFGSKSDISNIIGWTDCAVERNSSFDFSLLSENMTPKFENIREKGSNENTVVQLKSQIISLTNNCISLNDINEKLKQHIQVEEKKYIELEEKNKILYEIISKTEEEK